MTGLDNEVVDGDDNTVLEPTPLMFLEEVKVPCAKSLSKPKVKLMAKTKSIKKTKKPRETSKKEKLMKKNSKPTEKKVFKKGGGISNKTQVMRKAIFRNFASHYCTEFEELRKVTHETEPNKLLQMLVDKEFLPYHLATYAINCDELVEIIRVLIYKHYHTSIKANQPGFGHLKMNEVYLSAFRDVAYKYKKSHMLKFFDNKHLNFVFEHFKANAR